VSAEIDKAVAMLSELILSTSDGRSECADASRQLAGSTDPNVVRAISDSLIKTLRAIEVKHTALEQQLIGSRQQMESVQQTLATVTIEANLDTVTGLRQPPSVRFRPRTGRGTCHWQQPTAFFCS